MTKNTITIKDGVMTSDINRQVSTEYQCKCGKTYTVNLQLPDNMSQIKTNAIAITNQKCQECGEPVILPGGTYVVEGFQLIRRPELH